MYLAFGMLMPQTDFDMAEAARRLAVKLPTHLVELRAGVVSVAAEGWEIHLTLDESAHVQEESRDIAERIGGANDANDIAACSRRVEVASDIPDPEMEHFNDYLLVIEVLQSFRGLIAIDPQEPSLL